MNTAASIFSTAVDTFNKGISILLQGMKAGFDDIYNTYNKTFQNISTRTGMSSSAYQNAVRGLAGQGTSTLGNYQGINGDSLDLYNNIATSDIQEMWNTLANTGMGEADIIAGGIETVITQNIVPYLDLTSKEMQRFNQNTEGTLFKQLRGITQLNQDMFDSNVVTTEYLQEQLEYLAPMSEVAEIDLLSSTEGGLAQLEGMRKAGMSDSMIAAAQRNTRAVQEDPFGALTSGNLLRQLTVMDGMKKNINFYTDYDGVTTSTLDMSGFMGNTFGSKDSLLNSAAFNALGMSDFQRVGYEINNTDYDNKLANVRNTIASKDEMTDAMKKAAELAEKLFANDQNQTAEQTQLIWQENLTSDLATWRMEMGQWFDVLTVAVKGIATLLVAKLGGNVISSLIKGGR